MTTTVAPNLELLGTAKHVTTDDSQHTNQMRNQEVMQRRFVGGSVGYVYPTDRYAHAVGGSAGWVHPW